MMENDGKIRRCPDCGCEMESGFFQVYRNASFHKKRIRFSAVLEDADLYLTSESMLGGECSYDGWHCKDCGMILFDYKDPRAGRGKTLLDAVADGIEGAFDALDKRFGGWITEEENPKKWDSPAGTEEKTVEKAEPDTAQTSPKPKKRIITSSGVKEVDEE